jgi:hypothetical protein
MQAYYIPLKVPCSVLTFASAHFWKREPRKCANGTHVFAECMHRWLVREVSSDQLHGSEQTLLIVRMNMAGCTEKPEACASMLQADMAHLWLCTA